MRKPVSWSNLNLEAAYLAYLSYVERKVFPGGCFFAGLYPEMDARSGPVRDAAVDLARGWYDWVGQLSEAAQARGEIAADADLEQLAFELNAVTEMANYHYLLFDDVRAVERGRQAVARILVSAAG